MNELIKFDFSELAVRVFVDEKGEPWWIANDICNILGLTDTGKSVQRLDDNEKLIRKLFVSGQERNVYTVNESGLYSLIFTSTKPQAKQFKQWVTSEVLPTLRKTGSYSIAGEIKNTSKKELIESDFCVLHNVKSLLNLSDVQTQSLINNVCEKHGTDPKIFEVIPIPKSNYRIPAKINGSGFYSRLAAIQDESGLNKAQFSKKIGITASFYGDLRLGRVKWGQKVIDGIAKAFPDIDLNWLVKG